jgi:hypothetical protein
MRYEAFTIERKIRSDWPGIRSGHPIPLVGSVGAWNSDRRAVMGTIMRSFHSRCEMNKICLQVGGLGDRPVMLVHLTNPATEPRNLSRHRDPRGSGLAASTGVGQQVGKTLNSTLRSRASDRSSAPVPTMLFFEPTPVAMMCPRKPGASNSRRSLT